MDPFAETERSPADCVNYYKEVIPERSTYTPVEDPCTLCVCINGEPKYCEFTHCSTPKPTVSKSLYMCNAFLIKISR